VLERQVVRVTDERLLVEQHGEFRFLVFAQAMTVTLDIEHRSQRVAEASATRFDLGPLRPNALDVFDGRYELVPQPTRGSKGTPRVLLHYTATIGLKLPPPPAIGHVAVRQNLAVQLEALAEEVARRARSAR
jgi:hypothetical protein